MSTDQIQAVKESTFPMKAFPASPQGLPENEAQLADSELKYQRLVEGISGDYVIYTHDPDGVITYVSPSIEKALGFPVNAVIGLNWRDLIGEHFIGREIADRVEGEVAEGKKFYNFTVEISHADGNTRLLDIQQQPLFNALGQYVSMEGIAKDITKVTRDAEELQKLKQDLELRVAERTAELIQSNELLRKSEESYRSFVDCQTEFVVRWLPGAIITFVNEAYCRFTGRSRDELLGWCFLPVIHPEDAIAFQESICQLNAENPYDIFENRVVLPDGSVRWTQWSNQILFDENGKFLEYQSVGRDITELRAAADTIREKEAHLAYMSRLTTIGELVAGVAHEVHQPLHAAKIFAEAARRNLEQGEPNNIETAIDCTKEISSAIARTANIIRSLRNYSDANPIVFKQLDLNQVIQQASELIVFETRKSHAVLEYDLCQDLPPIQGDQIQLQQICVNLLINTCEAMEDVPAEQRTVFISTNHDQQNVRLEICDSGCGVSDDEFDKMFNAFFTTKNQRVGMGLSLCKSIAEAHGGKIWGKKNRELGMTFVLELPFMRENSRT